MVMLEFVVVLVMVASMTSLPVPLGSMVRSPLVLSVLMVLPSNDMLLNVPSEPSSL